MSAGFAFAQDAPNTSLFTAAEAGAAVPANLAREPGVRRIEAVRMNIAAFSSSAPFASSFRRETEASPESSVDVNWTNAERMDKDGTVVWTGSVRGAPFGSAILVTKGNTITGSISRGDGVSYQIRTAADGSQWLLTIDEKSLPAVDDDPFRTPAPTGPLPLRSLEQTASDDGTFVDVLVLYTAAARIGAGGTTQMHQLVELAIAQTNLAYAASGVTHWLRLAHVGEIGYTESGNSGDDLTRLRSKTDGYLDEAHAFRDTFQADIVSLWVESTSDGIAGRAYLVDPSSPREDYAFSMVVRSYAVSSYAFAHEVGHNLGAAHSRRDYAQLPASGYAGAYPYSYGYKKEYGEQRFRDIMAYDCPAGCPVIPYFSNPDVSYMGIPTGIDENASNSANNVLTFENTRSIVANYRSSGTSSVDRTGPRLTILSHQNGQVVSKSTVILAGATTDSGYGDHGISSVTVNGHRASGDTAPGAGVAFWEFSLVLSPGLNTIQVVARDDDANQNPSVATIVLNYLVAKPANDNFSRAIQLSNNSGLIQGTNTGATAESGEPLVSTASNSVWWFWRPSVSGPVTIDTEGSNFDTILSVYTGSGIGSLALAARNDNDGAFFTSRTTFSVAAGTNYYIGVTGFEGATGSVVLRWLIEGGADAIGPRITISNYTDGETLAASTVTLIGTATDSGSGNNGVRSVTVNGVRAVGDTAAGAGVANWRATVALHKGANTFLIVATDDSPRRNTTTTTLVLNSSDQFPTNDRFLDATSLTGVSGATTGRNTFGTLETGEPGPATGTVWWKWNPPLDATATFDTSGSDFDTILSVFTGNVIGNLTRVVEDDDGGGNLTSRVSFIARSGVNYFIRVGGSGAASGNIALRWSSIGVDIRGPSVTITSHSDGQMVPTNVIAISGFSDDYGTGSNGISSVTINGVRASFDTATGADTATWIKAVSLNPGENLFSFVVRDNSPGQNSTGGSFMINYVPGSAPVSSPSAYVIPEYGVFASRMDRQPGANLSTGYARVMLSSGPAPAGMAVFTYRQSDTIISEAAVPASRRFAHGSLYVETSAAIKTGVAIANPNNTTAVVSFRFKEGVTGSTIKSGSFDIPANQQVAAFLDEAIFGGPSTLTGTFEFDATVPVAAIALRGLYNERSEFLMTTMPVVDRTVVLNSVESEIAHFADGGGWASQLVLFNPGSTVMAGDIRWTGPDGRPVAMDVRGPFCSACPVASDFHYEIPAGGAYVLRTSSGLDAVRTGRVGITPTMGSRPAAYLIFASRRDNVTVSEASVVAMPGTTALRVYVGNEDLTTGLAISAGERGADIQLELFDGLGRPTGLRGTLSVPPRGKVSKFVKEIPGFAAIPDVFRGVMRITGGCCFSAVGLRTRVNERGDFLITTTAPVAESDTPVYEEIVFPHLAVGQGYYSEIILFSSAVSQTASGELQQWSREGNPYPVMTFWIPPVPTGVELP